MCNIKFREEPIPKHRENRPVCEKYSSYLGTLKIDFNKRCGYCNDVHSYRIRSFAIDHFVPRNPRGFTHPILPNVYNNLVYSCNYCNSAKSNKFPTKNHLIHNDGQIGFVMPTDKSYDDLFCRDSDGTIQSKDNNALANHIIEELNLKNPIHSLMWRLEKLVKLTDIVTQKITETSNQELITIQNELYAEYYKITRSIFKNNDK